MSLIRCGQVLLSTHSFQAPGFYERLGYEREASIEGYPKGHANVFYLKKLAREDGCVAEHPLTQER
jgi:ribosomal protein S18 acetylase RimI-like enzyme